jgi:hypothetical protein
MLIGGIVVAAVVVVSVVALLTRRVAHDDVHSVEGYHRSLHTLEGINAHPMISGSDERSGQGAKSAYPESAVRVASPSTGRVAALPGSVPPVPIPPLAAPDAPMTFLDAEVAQQPLSPPVPPRPVQRDKAMISINHRPRRLAAPATAVAVVLVLVVVLLLTGSHTVPPGAHSSDKNSGRSGHNGSTAPQPSKKKATTTTSTPPPLPVSSPQAATAQSATYDVTDTTFTVTLTATSGACWVDATSSATGTTLFSGTLAAGAQHSFSATGPVTLIVGAPTILHATVDGDAVVLPPGFQTPFTMSFVTTAATAPG